MTEATAVLKKKEDRRIHNGHQWVFSNEIQEILGEPANGDCVRVRSSTGESLGMGFFNRNSLIAIRMFSSNASEIPVDLLGKRILAADKRRTSLGYDGTYRMIFGESDFIPGLIVDRYEGNLVIESFSAGIDKLIGEVVEILDNLFKPIRVIEKSVSMWRSYEGLPNRLKVWKGDEEAFTVKVDKLSYCVQVFGDQKTGLFLDQRGNRSVVEAISHGKHVLDCFSNVGGFAMHAARGGAEKVLAVDISAQCNKSGRENARLNGLDRIQFVESDVFEFFKNNTDRFDVIVLDPPAFVKNKKSLPVGLKAYRRLNELAMESLSEGGILVTASCSHHVSPQHFLEMLNDASNRRGKRLSVFQIAGAGADHPVLLSMPETQYLTCVFAHAVTSGQC